MVKHVKLNLTEKLKPEIANKLLLFSYPRKCLTQMVSLEESQLLLCLKTKLLYSETFSN